MTGPVIRAWRDGVATADSPNVTPYVVTRSRPYLAPADASPTRPYLARQSREVEAVSG